MYKTLQKKMGRDEAVRYCNDKGYRLPIVDEIKAYTDGLELYWTDSGETDLNEENKHYKGREASTGTHTTFVGPRLLRVLVIERDREIEYKLYLRLKDKYKLKDERW